VGLLFTWGLAAGEWRWHSPPSSVLWWTGLTIPVPFHVEMSVWGDKREQNVVTWGPWNESCKLILCSGQRARMALTSTAWRFGIEKCFGRQPLGTLNWIEVARDEIHLRAILLAIFQPSYLNASELIRFTAGKTPWILFCALLCSFFSNVTRVWSVLTSKSINVVSKGIVAVWGGGGFMKRVGVSAVCGQNARFSECGT